MDKEGYNMGVYILGLYISHSEYKKEDGTKSYAIMVATENEAYKVYMASNFDAGLLESLSIGVPVRITCKPYVNKNGRLSWGAGCDLRVGE